MSETSNQSITITREKGDADDVTVSWGVYKSYRDMELASDDFQPYQGSIVFKDKETKKVRWNGQKLTSFLASRV